MFADKLKEKISNSFNNSFEDNYDFHRFGKKNKKVFSFKDYLRKKFINPGYIARWRIDSIFNNSLNIYSLYIEGLNSLYDMLEDEDSKNLLVEVIAYRIMGYEFIKLSTNNSLLWASLKRAESCLENGEDYIKSGFLNWRLQKFDLRNLGYDAKLYYTPMGITIDFILEQYAYSRDKSIVKAQKNDIVIDAGGCWGDTAVYFATQVGEKGKVYSFEFIPENVKIFKKNIEINPKLSSIINLIQKPLFEQSGCDVYYIDNGPGSTVSFDIIDGYTGKIQSQCIDDFVADNNIPLIDFIKMDIEGAELPALKGAISVIKQFRPKLAIAIYHNMDDIVQIPKFLNDLNLGYKFYLGHYTIHQEETVLFATASE